MKNLRAAFITILLLAGCGTSQHTLADLVAALGNTTAAVETFENHTYIATKITTDTQTAQTEVLQWVPGTTTHTVVQALDLVLADLRLVPASTNPTDASLLALTISTTDELLADFGQSVLAPAPGKQRTVIPTTSVGGNQVFPSQMHLQNILNNFKSSRNRILAADPSRNSLMSDNRTMEPVACRPTEKTARGSEACVPGPTDMPVPVQAAVTRR